MAAIRFGKYHGLYNDFAIVDGRELDPTLQSRVCDPNFVRGLCDRRGGIGADGLLLVLPPLSDKTIATMKVVNSDGTIAEMCGNGLRCVAFYLFTKDSPSSSGFFIDTGAGPLRCDVLPASDSLPATVQINMGKPRWQRSEIPVKGIGTFIEQADSSFGTDAAFTAVSMGNPHCIHFSESGDLMELAQKLGPTIEKSPLFPNRTNVEFAKRNASNNFDLIVWERGAGITQACGTGACATAVAACLTDRAKTDTDIDVNLPGGTLAIRVNKALDSVQMTGPVVHVFDGSFALP